MCVDCEKAGEGANEGIVEVNAKGAEEVEANSVPSFLCPPRPFEGYYPSAPAFSPSPLILLSSSPCKAAAGL
jgi:hypothetical protein